jgi:hypothetical protein
VISPFTIKNNLFFIDFGLLSTFRKTLNKKTKILDFLIFTAPEYIIYNYIINNKSFEEFKDKYLLKLKEDLEFYDLIIKLYPEEKIIEDLKNSYDKYSLNIEFSVEDKRLLDIFSLI